MELARRKKLTSTSANVLRLFTEPKERQWPKAIRKQAKSEWCGGRLQDLMVTVELSERNSGITFHQKQWALLLEWYVIWCNSSISKLYFTDSVWISPFYYNRTLLFWTQLFQTPRYFELIFVSLGLKSSPFILNSNYKVDGQTSDGIRTHLEVQLTYLSPFYLKCICLVPLRTVPVVNNSMKICYSIKNVLCIANFLK